MYFIFHHYFFFHRDGVGLDGCGAQDLRRHDEIETPIMIPNSMHVSMRRAQFMASLKYISPLPMIHSTPVGSSSVVTRVNVLDLACDIIRANHGFLDNEKFTCGEPGGELISE